MSSNENGAAIEKLRQVVLDNLENEQFNVQELAEIYGVSRSKLHAIVKKDTGKSASKFIREIRLDEACKMLKDSELTVSEIAYRVGFGSPTYFASCFKATYHITPLEYRIKTDMGTSEVGKNQRKTNPTSKFQSLFNNRTSQRILLIVSIVVLASFGIWKLTSKPKLTENKTVAVLPFANISPDSTNNYFSDGLSEEIANQLAKVKNLQVAASTSAFMFRDNENVSFIADQLNVNYLVEGSVRQIDGQVRIVVRLIDAKNGGYNVWSESFDKKMENILALQDEISLNITEALELEFSENQTTHQHKIDPEAYRLYLEAVQIAKTGEAANLLQAIEMINQALEIDPNFAQAHAKLVHLYWLYPTQGDMAHIEMQKLAENHLKKAIVIDSTMGEVYFAKGLMGIIKNDSTITIKSLRKAVELMPNNSDAFNRLAGVLNMVGNYHEAFEYRVKANEMDPLNPRIAFLAARDYYFNKKEYKKGHEILDNVIENVPENNNVRLLKSLFYMSEPEGNVLRCFKGFYAEYLQTPEDKFVLGYLSGLSRNIGLLPLAEDLVDKYQILYPKNNDFFQTKYELNKVKKSHLDNIELVNLWIKKYGLSSSAKADKLSYTYYCLGEFEKAKRAIEDFYPEILDVNNFSITEFGNYSYQRIRFSRLVLNYIQILKALGQHLHAEKYASVLCDFAHNVIMESKHNKSLGSYVTKDLRLLCPVAKNDLTRTINLLEKSFYEEKNWFGILDLITSEIFLQFLKTNQSSLPLKTGF